MNQDGSGQPDPQGATVDAVIQDMVAGLSARVDDLNQEVVGMCHDQIPELNIHRETVGLTSASGRSNIVTMFGLLGFAGVVWAWVASRSGFPESALASLPGGPDVGPVALALGEPAYGVDGFRVTHQQAVDAHRVAGLASRPSGAITRYGEIATMALMAGDVERAREFVVAELGTLADESPSSARLRETLEAYLDAGGRWRATAERLGVHENTVMHRVRRAESIIGHSVNDRRFELEAALRLVRTLGS